MKLTRNLVIGLAAMLAWVNLAASQEEPKRPADPKISVGIKQNPTCPALTRIRFYPRKGFAQRMLKGRFSGSNAGKTTDFKTIAEIKETPPEGQWTEIQLAKPVCFRYLKYESPAGGWGNVAEVEFYSGDEKDPGPAVWHHGFQGPQRQRFLQGHGRQRGNLLRRRGAEQPVCRHRPGPRRSRRPRRSSRPSRAPISPRRRSRSLRPRRRKIRIARNGGTPAEEGEKYKGPIKVEKGTVLVAVAYTDQLAASEPVIAPYRIGQTARDEKTVRTFHIGNSLTDTVVGWLQPVAESAGRKLDFHRFTIPGAPTDWLWTHPGGGFGDSRYPEAFFVLAPIDHIFTQPFHGHDRSISNEAEYSGKFFDLCRKHSPDVQAWVYVQWPGPAFQDRWSQGKGATAELKLRPAKTWQEGVANHVAYTEAVAERTQQDLPRQAGPDRSRRHGPGDAQDGDGRRPRARHEGFRCRDFRRWHPPDAQGPLPDLAGPLCLHLQGKPRGQGLRADNRAHQEQAGDLPTHRLGCRKEL